MSTAEERRVVVLDRAVHTFAEGGWSGTTIADVAAAAGISTAYVVKLFPSKEKLFVAALDECFTRIQHILTEAVASAAVDPAKRLEAMGAAYAALIRDRSLLMLQVHAQAASNNVPGIAAAFRSGVAAVVDTVERCSGAPADAVQHFVAMGQLCHLVVISGALDIDEPWAQVLRYGLRH